jgi:hypothetical protein
MHAPERFAIDGDRIGGHDPGLAQPVAHCRFKRRDVERFEHAVQRRDAGLPLQRQAQGD